MKNLYSAVVVSIAIQFCQAYSCSEQPLARRAFLASACSAAVVAPAAQAFDGTGSSAYSGRSPQSKEQLRRSYQARVAADVRDFNALGASIAQGSLTESDAWKFFFIPFPRNQADQYGRSYAALADFIGHRGDSGKLEGGDGYLLAASFTKAGKPPDNTPAVKAYGKLASTFEPIRAAGEKGDAKKAKAAWDAAAGLFSAYLETVEMPGALSDPLYR